MAKKGMKAAKPMTDLSIQMLGTFELQAAGMGIDDTMNRSKKMWNLLAYIITHRERMIPQQEGIDVLWPDEDSQNPVNALKTLLYRIRILLEPLQQACGAEFILSQRGSYSWNNEINWVLDIDLFEQACKKAVDTARTQEERLAAYQEAFSLYKGDFLPKLGDQLWVVPISTHYHSMYLGMVKSYAELLEEKCDYRAMSEVCTKAIAIDSLDETLHCMLIRALLGQGEDLAALAHYETATGILYRNLGVKPSEALRALYLEIMKTRKTLETDLTVIQNQLKETESRPGAFVCEYGFFREAYRLEARRAERLGMTVFIGLFTVSNINGEIPPLDQLNSIMDMLLVSIKGSLRRGDVASRYSGAQFVVMLPSVTYESGDMVMNRIVQHFCKLNKRRYIALHYKLQQLDLLGVES